MYFMLTSLWFIEMVSENYSYIYLLILLFRVNYRYLQSPTDTYRYLKLLTLFQLKWSQIKYLYFAMLLATHFIYSVIYSTYSILVFKNLCIPELEDNETEVVCNFTVHSVVENDVVVYKDSHHESEIVCAQLAWGFLVVFTIVYMLKEITKLMYQRRRYL